MDAFARSTHFNYRQMYVYLYYLLPIRFTLMSYKMGKSEDLFIKFFMPYLKALCNDIVPNVKISLANVLSEIYSSIIIFIYEYNF